MGTKLEKKGKKLEKKVPFELVFFVPIANPSTMLQNLSKCEVKV